MLNSEQSFSEQPHRPARVAVHDDQAITGTPPIPPADFDSESPNRDEFRPRRSQANTDAEHLRLLSIFH